MLAERAASSETAAAVKGDAYGLGLEPVARALAETGCRTFFVAHLDEARKLRAVFEDSKATIYVLNGLLPGTAPDYATLGVRPVLGSLAEVDEWRVFGRSNKQAPAAAIQIDTGFNRLGLAREEVGALATDPGRFAGIDVDLVMSHLACADQPDHPMNAAQRELFDAARAMLPTAPASLANSGGILNGPEFHYDLVRPGIALYGGRAVSGRDNPMQPVVRLEVPILQVRNVREGAVVGYGATYRFEAPARIAVVSIGYADGFLRCLGASNERLGGRLFVAGQPAPLVGRVSMDLVAIDVTAVSDEHLARGAPVEVIGEHQNIDDIAAAAGTIGYEVLTRLGLRHTRVYSGA